MAFNRNKIFQAAFNIVRKNPMDNRENMPEIACGFGFKHKDNVTSYYVSPLNSSRRKETYLAQPIAEAISTMNRILVGDYTNINFYTDSDYTQIYLSCQVPLYCHRMEMVPANVKSYRV